MIKKLFLLCLLLLFLYSANALQVSFELFAPLQHDANNIFIYRINCDTYSDALKEGDIIVYFVAVCYNSICNLQEQKTFTYKVPCTEQNKKAFALYIPQQANGTDINSVQFVWLGKRWDSSSYNISFIKSFAYFNPLDIGGTLPAVPPAGKIDLSWLFILGFAIFVIGIMTLFMRWWLGIIPLLLGIVLMIISVFF